jgi:hypothetical protein
VRTICIPQFYRYSPAATLIALRILPHVVIPSSEEAGAKDPIIIRDVTEMSSEEGDSPPKDLTTKCSAGAASWISNVEVRTASEP